MQLYLMRKLWKETFYTGGVKDERSRFRPDSLNVCCESLQIHHVSANLVSKPCDFICHHRLPTNYLQMGQNFIGGRTKSGDNLCNCANGAQSRAYW